MNPFKLFDPSYLFDSIPGETFLYFWPLIIFYIIAFAASFKVKELISKRKNPKLAAQYFGGFTMRLREFTIVGAILAFARNENIPYLGMRFWTVLLIATFIIYGIWLWRRYELNFEASVISKKKKTVIDKYKPQPKKKKKKKRR